MSSHGDEAAERLFAAWAAEHEAGRGTSFSALLAAHPAHAAELQQMHDDWCAFAPVLANVVPGRLDNEVPLPSGLRGDDAQEVAPEVVAALRNQLQEGGRYLFRRVLGQGGGGVVLKVWDRQLHRMLAMKVVSGRRGGRSAPPPVADPRALARFVDEARIASQLDHPGIVPVHELGVDADGRVFFTMRLVVGEDLSTIFARCAGGDTEWTRTRVLGVLAKVCEAVAYAHARGVVHRDLKPANVRVGQHGDVQVMDWGLARARRSADAAPVDSLRAESPGTGGQSGLETAVGTILGTPCYMAPEQARGESAQADAVSDVYAIGAMLYELLTGHAPYRAQGEPADALAVIRRVAAGPPQRLAEVATDVPPELAAICERAMARARGDRYPTAAALEHDLRAFLEGRVVAAFETGAWAETKKWMQRNRALATAIGLLLLASLVGTVVANWFRVEAKELAVAEGNARRVVESQQAAMAFEAARLHASYGDWTAATAGFDKAAALGHDEVAVLVERVLAHDARFELAQRDELLTGLEGRGDLGEHAALVAVLCNDPTRPVGGLPRKDHEQALAAAVAVPSLPEPWRHYASALLAETMPDCRRHLEAALAVDSRNRPAHELWLSVQLLTRGAEVASDAAAFARIWQRDPYTRIFLSVANAIADEANAGARTAAATGADGDLAEVAYLLRLRRMAKDGLAVARRSLVHRLMRKPTTVAEAMAAMSQVMDDLGTMDTAAGARMARVPPFVPAVLRRMFGQMVAGMALNADADVVAKWGAAAAQLDLPTQQTVHGLLRVLQGAYAEGLATIQQSTARPRDLFACDESLPVCRALATIWAFVGTRERAQPQPRTYAAEMVTAIRDVLHERVAVTMDELYLFGLAASVAGDRWLAAECASRLMQLPNLGEGDHHLAKLVAFLSENRGFTADIHAVTLAENVPSFTTLYWESILAGQMAPPTPLSGAAR